MPERNFAPNIPAHSPDAPPQGSIFCNPDNIFGDRVKRIMNIE